MSGRTETFKGTTCLPRDRPDHIEEVPGGGDGRLSGGRDVRTGRWSGLEGDAVPRRHFTWPLSTTTTRRSSSCSLSGPMSTRVPTETSSCRRIGRTSRRPSTIRVGGQSPPLTPSRVCLLWRVPAGLRCVFRQQGHLRPAHPVRGRPQQEGLLR